VWFDKEILIILDIKEIQNVIIKPQWWVTDVGVYSTVMDHISSYTQLKIIMIVIMTTTRYTFIANNNILLVQYDVTRTGT